MLLPQLPQRLTSATFLPPFSPPSSVSSLSLLFGASLEASRRPEAALPPWTWAEGSGRQVLT